MKMMIFCTSAQRLQQVLHHLLQPQQVDELVIGGRRQEVELGRGRFGRRDLQQRFLQLFAQRQFRRRLTAGRRFASIRRSAGGLEVCACGLQEQHA